MQFKKIAKQNPFQANRLPNPLAVNANMILAIGRKKPRYKVSTKRYWRWVFVEHSLTRK